MTHRISLPGVQIPFTEFNRLWTATALEVVDCPKLICIDVFPSVARSILLRNCANLTHLPAFPQTVESITIVNCPALEHLPRLPPGLKSLRLSETGIKVIPPRDWPDEEPTMPAGLNITALSEELVVPWHEVYDRMPSQYTQRWTAYHRSAATPNASEN